MSDKVARTLVRDLMSVGVLTCARDTPLTTLTRTLLEKGQEAAVVLDEQGNAAGVVDRAMLVEVHAHPEEAPLVAASEPAIA